MRLRLRAKSPGIAWLKSVPVALLIPLPFWLVGEVFTTPSERMSTMLFAVVALALGVHLASYFIFGVPLFLRFFRNPSALVWRIPWALTLGCVLGIIALLIALGLFGYSGRLIIEPQIYAIGAGYGLATAIAAYIARPEYSERDVPPKSDRAGG